MRELRGGNPERSARASQRILLLVSAHDSLSQCAYVALTELGKPSDHASLVVEMACRGSRRDR